MSFFSTLFSAVCPRNMTLSGFKDSVMELIQFVGHLASLGLQLEGSHALLLSFILDFYETVNKPIQHFSSKSVHMNLEIFYVIWFQSVCVTLKFLQLCHDFYPQGLRHISKVWTAPHGDASSWSLLPSFTGHWPCQCGQAGLHHAQVGIFAPHAALYCIFWLFSLSFPPLCLPPLVFCSTLYSFNVWFIILIMQ